MCINALGNKEHTCIDPCYSPNRTEKKIFLSLFMRDTASQYLNHLPGFSSVVLISLVKEKKSTKNGELKFTEVFSSVWLSINVCREKLAIPRLCRQSSPILHPWLQWHSEGQSNCHKLELCLCKEVQGVVVSVTTLCIDQCAVVYARGMTLLLYKYCTLYNCCLSNIELAAPTVKGV